MSKLLITTNAIVSEKILFSCDKDFDICLLPFTYIAIDPEFTSIILISSLDS